MAPIVARIERQIARAEHHAIEQGVGKKSLKLVRDISVIAGISLTMLGIKALKVLPSVPFAPGHKLVILTPLYIVATLLTYTRFGGTLTGVTMGTVAFLMGDGRYGIFEILKHIAPGLISDAIVPFMIRDGKKPGPVAMSILGGVIAVGRFATIFTVSLAVQAPKAAFAMLLPGLSVHVTFGVMSGYVSYHLVRAIGPLFKKRELDANAVEIEQKAQEEPT